MRKPNEPIDPSCDAPIAADDTEDVLPIPGSDLLETHVCELDGERLDAFLTRVSAGRSRTFVKSLIDEGRARVDERPARASLRLKAGQTVTVEIPAPTALDVVAQDIPLDIVYEDDDIIVINKPKGMVVHPAPGNPDGTLVNALLHHCGASLSDINGVLRPGIVHRIDKETSGLVAVAKTNAAHRSLSQQLQDHSMARTYEAIVDGVVKPDSGTVDAPVGRHPVDRKRMAVVRVNGRRAVTHWEVVERYGSHTRMRYRLETGRTHQIRVHMASIGHPVTGDPVYGKPCRLMKTEGQMLHAWRLEFRHPVSGLPVCCEAPLPDEFVRLLAILDRKAR